jgi:C_GCAxxG_C_C family probable redox protein
VAYAEKLNFDPKLALSISCGFGGGMGRLQETCGAVTGAFMVLGIYNCGKYSDNKERKAMTYQMVRDFNQKFTAIHHSANCKQLLNADLNTAEGQKFVQENNLHEKVCEKCIASSVKILDGMMN